MSEYTEGYYATDAEKAEKESQRSEYESRKSEAKKRKKEIEAKIERLKAVYNEIGGKMLGYDGYDGDLNEQVSALKNIYKEKLEWTGKRFDTIHEIFMEQLKDDAKKMRKASTVALLDALVGAISALEDDKTEYWGIIEWCDDRLRDIRDWFAKLLN